MPLTEQVKTTAYPHARLLAILRSHPCPRVWDPWGWDLRSALQPALQGLWMPAKFWEPGAKVPRMILMPSFHSSSIKWKFILQICSKAPAPQHTCPKLSDSINLTWNPLIWPYCIEIQRTVPESWPPGLRSWHVCTSQRCSPSCSRVLSHWDHRRLFAWAACAEFFINWSQWRLSPERVVKSWSDACGSANGT